jgi:hypothetical protein
MLSSPVRDVVVVWTLAVLACLGMPHAAPGVESDQDEEGFVSLFNGEDLSQWKGATHIYFVRDGAIVCPALAGNRVDRSKTWNLYTEKEYANFIFRFEFRLSPKANNGLSIRVPFGQADNELQIVDDAAMTDQGRQPYQFHGSIYGVVPAEQGHQKPAGEWNSQEVIADGRRLTVKLNGATIVDVENLDETVSQQRSGWKRPKGHLCFKGHSGPPLEFRNIRIKELD